LSAHALPSERVYLAVARKRTLFIRQIRGHFIATAEPATISDDLVQRQQNFIKEIDQKFMKIIYE
jgi:hypothetical protein